MKALPLFLLVSSCFAAPTADRYAFWFLDSAGTLQRKSEILIKSKVDPDTTQIHQVSNSLNYQEDYRINSKVVDGSWLTYSAPSPDLGEVVLVSNTVPTYPLLRMQLDMMGIAAFYCLGHITQTSDWTTTPAKLNIQAYKNDFRFGGDTLTDQDRARVAKGLGDYMLSTKPGVINIHVFKFDPRSTENHTAYVAYSNFTAKGVDGISATSEETAKKPLLNQVDALGRARKSSSSADHPAGKIQVPH